MYLFVVVISLLIKIFLMLLETAGVRRANICYIMSFFSLYDCTKLKLEAFDLLFNL